MRFARHGRFELIKSRILHFPISSSDGAIEKWIARNTFFASYLYEH
jgi:hypothetical protein